MPTLYNIEAEVDIDPIEFMESCKDRDITKIIKYLAKNEYISDESYQESKKGIWENDFSQKLLSLKTKYHSMSKEEIDFIINLSNKYGI